jgi:hypothetical protein
MVDAKRLAALEAVAEAVETWIDTPLGEGNTLNQYMAVKVTLREWQGLRDALPEPQPAGETVTLAVWRHIDGGAQLVIDGSEAADHYAFLHGWTRLGTVTLPLAAEVGT